MSNQFMIDVANVLHSLQWIVLYVINDKKPAAEILTMSFNKL